jgi:hypothetical protein
MTLSARARSTWLVVVLFAIGMAWVEAACVYYLRLLVGRLDPYQANPLPAHGVVDQVELVREAATLVMLFAIGMLAGLTWHSRLAYTAIAFGVWDIFYYVFLKVIYDWPKSLFDWDVLFLLPLPWWGPVLAPVCIAVLMIVWGTLVSQHAVRVPATPAMPVLWGLDRTRRRHGALRLHGRFAARGATRTGHDRGIANGLQVVRVHRRPGADGHTGREHRLEYAAQQIA